MKGIYIHVYAQLTEYRVDDFNGVSASSC